MVTINKINLKEHDTIQKEFSKNIGLVLQKIGTSHKTRALHQLISKEMLYVGFGIKDISNKRSAVYGTRFLTGNKLSGLIADISAIVDKADLSDVSKKIRDLDKAKNELSRVKTTITDTSSIQMKNLDEKIKQLFQDIIDSIDYFTLVDVYYYLYVETLTSIGLKGNGKNKIFETTYNVFRAVINKVLNKLHVKVEDSERKKLDVILDYIFIRSFTDQSAQTTLAKLSRMYGEESVTFLKELKPNDYDEFKNIATLLTKGGIVNITESAFMNEFTTIVGESSKKSMNGTFDELVAYIISANYKSSLFDAPNISREDQERLEQLILNFKKDITLKG